jgi:hypothetical protein
VHGEGFGDALWEQLALDTLDVQLLRAPDAGRGDGQPSPAPEGTK